MGHFCQFETGWSIGLDLDSTVSARDQPRFDQCPHLPVCLTVICCSKPITGCKPSVKFDFVINLVHIYVDDILDDCNPLGPFDETFVASPFQYFGKQSIETLAKQVLPCTTMSKPAHGNLTREGYTVKDLFVVEEMLLFNPCIFYRRTKSVMSARRQFSLICHARQNRLKGALSMTINPGWSLYV